ncbi:hypothetical protein Dred_0808 [Desulforamulus reducens MI-1]|uniref:Uncharacterized protein n=1 Tax=Desulforamulus reducens (strain ATCC BAA-1160 / DSM 100696 / MI-1) TaxID=349161 RepID=A4J2P3_DESRM|nr:hypothetical protein Dred_0808 [Desulforamulus reducens MI-1]
MRHFFRIYKPCSKNDLFSTSIFEIIKTYFQIFIYKFSSIRVFGINQKCQRTHLYLPSSLPPIYTTTNTTYWNETKGIKHITSCKKTPNYHITKIFNTNRFIQQSENNKVNKQSNIGTKPRYNKTSKGQSQYIGMIRQIVGINRASRVTVGDCISSILVGFTPGIFLLVIIFTMYSHKLLLLSLKTNLFKIQEISKLYLLVTLSLFLIIVGICQLTNGLLVVSISRTLRNKNLYILYPKGRLLQVKVDKTWVLINFFVGTLCPVIIPTILWVIFFDIKIVNVKSGFLLFLLLCLVLNALHDNWNYIWEEQIKSNHTKFFLQQLNFRKYQ